MIDEERITNKKTSEELSLSIIGNGYEDEDGGTFDCVIEIKRKRIVCKVVEKNAK